MLKVISIALVLAGQPAAEPEPPPASESTQTTGQENKKTASPGPGEADGQAPESPAQSPEEDTHILSSGALGLLLRGGFFMWPILILGIVASGVIIERYRSLKMLNTDSGEVRTKVADLLHAGRVEKAIEFCHGERGPVAAVLTAGLRKFLVLRRLGYDAQKTEEQVVKAMDDYGSHIVAALERHLPILATVSSVAPMLGFLGTVHGMIIAFDNIVARMGETNIVEAAAGGISVALLTTCFGLIVGIPAFMAFNYFTSVINRFVLQVEESATGLIETVTLQMALSSPALPATGPQSKGESS